MATLTIAETLQESARSLWNTLPLLIAETVLLVLVLGVLPWIAGKGGQRSAPLRGLNLPRGSVRSMLALVSVGTLAVVATFGINAFSSPEHYQRVVTTLGTLAGPILGFYFGSRHAASHHRVGTDQSFRGAAPPANPRADTPHKKI